MKRNLALAVAVVCLLAFASNASAGFILDPNGATGGYDPLLVEQELDIHGRTYVENTFRLLESSTFEEWGTFFVAGSDGNPWPGSNNQITAVVDGVTGTTTPSSINFSGGTVSIYSDPVYNYGESAANANFNGANDGTLIATFAVTGGGGALQNFDPDNGELTIEMAATFLAADYWFDESGYDLSNHPPHQIVGKVTVNARIVDPTTGQIFEWDEYLTLIGEGGLPGGLAYENVFIGPNSNIPFRFFVSNGGQFSIEVIPEPASLVLLGSGLLGLAGFRRKKKRV